MKSQPLVQGSEGLHAVMDHVEHQLLVQCIRQDGGTDLTVIIGYFGKDDSCILIVKCIKLSLYKGCNFFILYTIERGSGSCYVHTN